MKRLNIEDRMLIQACLSKNSFVLECNKSMVKSNIQDNNSSYCFSISTAFAPERRAIE